MIEIRWKFLPTLFILLLAPARAQTALELMDRQALPYLWPRVVLGP